MDALTWLSVHHRKETESHFTEGFRGERPGNAAAREALWPLGRKPVPVLRCLERMCIVLSQSDLCTGQRLPVGGVLTKASGSWRGISSRPGCDLSTCFM